ESSEWRPGEQIPTESQLCEMYGTSRITIRQAVSILVSDGLIVREPGRGTFVREPSVTAGERGLTSFTQEMQALGLRAGATMLELLREPSPPEIAGHLEIEPGTPVVTVKRLRLGDGVPIGIQTAHLIASRFPGLEHADLVDASLYD